MKKPDKVKFVNGGIQKLYKFPNGYGSSVVMHGFSYGGDEGLWELAVINNIVGDFRKFDLCYDTEIAEDVLGYLSDIQVEDILEKIENL